MDEIKATLGNLKSRVESINGLSKAGVKQVYEEIEPIIEEVALLSYRSCDDDYEVKEKIGRLRTAFEQIAGIRKSDGHERSQHEVDAFHAVENLIEIMVKERES